jgi:hypothetical protein
LHTKQGHKKILFHTLKNTKKLKKQKFNENDKVVYKGYIGKITTIIPNDIYIVSFKNAIIESLYIHASALTKIIN